MHVKLLLCAVALLAQPASGADGNRFKVGDRVVLQPVAVMQISGVGPRASFVRKGVDEVQSDVANGRPLKVVSREKSELVYALRFLDEKDPFILLPVSRANEDGLRPVLSKEAASALLSRLSGVTGPAPALAPEFDLTMECVKAKTEPWPHLLLFRTLVAHEKDVEFTADHRRLLARHETFLAQEYGLALGVEPTAMKTELRKRLLFAAP